MNVAKQIGSMSARLSFKTRVLIACIVLLLFFDAVFLLQNRSRTEARWLISMPGVEASQRLDPNNWIFSSEWSDPRVPASSVNHGGDLEGASMFLDIMSCGPRGVEVDLATEPGRQMPVRFLITGSIGPTLPSCIGEKLPVGYVIERIEVAT